MSVTFLGPSVEATAVALEVFSPPDHPIDVRCPACNCVFDPCGPLHIAPLRRNVGKN